jgi:hypothetical protein
MLRMSIGTLFIVSLAGFACSDRPDLDFRAGSGGEPTGGHSAAGITSGSGGNVGSGGFLGGGAGGTSAGGRGGMSSCPRIMCRFPECVGGEFKPNPNHFCGCPICVPNSPDAGPAEDAGLRDSGCSTVECPILACMNGYLPSPEPCGCPICAAEDGTATD